MLVCPGVVLIPETPIEAFLAFPAAEVVNCDSTTIALVQGRVASVVIPYPFGFCGCFCGVHGVLSWCYTGIEVSFEYRWDSRLDSLNNNVSGSTIRIEHFKNSLGL